MKKSFLFLTFATLFLIGCSSPPPALEPAVEPIAESGSSQVSESVSGPVSTAEVVIGGEAAYPEPEVQAVAEDYPEPAAEQVVEGYPEPDEVAQEVVADVQSSVPDIAGEGDVDVVFVSARSSGDGTWNFAVTLEHADNGWEDYADGWDVVLPDGSVVKPNSSIQFTRLLTHPHDNEQPFTRSQSNIEIPADITTVYVRGHELVEGYGATVVAVDLTATNGDRFEVVR